MDTDMRRMSKHSVLGQGLDAIAALSTLLQSWVSQLYSCRRFIAARFSLRISSWMPRTWRHKRKALLIGCNYFRGLGGTWDALLNCQTDVTGLKNVLIELYGYAPEDVIVMFDSKDGGDTYGPLEPTKENILREMGNLVARAKRGDHFFLHYSGHSDQIPNEDHTEEDGKDEVILPCDYRDDDKYIIDDQLRELVVDSLPVGSSLTAIFDTCHSTTILDLPHYRCNRIYTPWRSKGRRPTDTIRDAIVRENDISMSEESQRAFQITQHQRTRNNRVVVRKSPIDLRPTCSPILTQFESSTLSWSKLSPWRRETLESPIPRCDSPVKEFCDGFCTAGPVAKPYVVQISSAKDSQRSWEGCGKGTLTRMIVDILREELYPSLHDLMEIVSYRTYDTLVEVHSYSRRARAAARSAAKMTARTRMARGAPDDGLDADNFEDPQISSLDPLDMNATFKV